MIRITVKGAEETAKLMKELPARIGFALFKSVQDASIMVQSLAKRNAPVFRGLLRVSIVQRTSVDGGRIVGEVGSGLPYADVVESGKAAGWFPSVRELKVWARRKLGDERLAYVVGRAISRRGFRAQPYLDPAAKEAEPRVFLLFANRLAEAMKQSGGNA